jgi:hypothetical protein
MLNKKCPLREDIFVLYLDVYPTVFFFFMNYLNVFKFNCLNKKISVIYAPFPFLIIKNLPIFYIQLFQNPNINS